MQFEANRVPGCPYNSKPNSGFRRARAIRSQSWASGSHTIQSQFGPSGRPYNSKPILGFGATVQFEAKSGFRCSRTIRSQSGFGAPVQFEPKFGASGSHTIRSQSLATITAGFHGQPGVAGPSHKRFPLLGSRRRGLERSLLASSHLLTVLITTAWRERGRSRSPNLPQADELAAVREIPPACDRE